MDLLCFQNRICRFSIIRVKHPPGPEVIKKFMLYSTEQEISTVIKTKILKNKYFSCLN